MQNNRWNAYSAENVIIPTVLGIINPWLFAPRLQLERFSLKYLSFEYI